MNTLVVPTDFSAAAEHATAYAAQLAAALEATVLLVHVYQVPVPMTEFPVLLVTADDVRQIAEENLQRAVEAAQKNYGNVRFDTEARLGDIVSEVEDICKEQSAIAVVIGTKNLNGVERFLFGDTSVSFIKNFSYPVISVPDGATLAVPTNAVLATDLQNNEDIPAAKITDIIRLLKANLHVVHVKSGDEKEAASEPLMNRLAGINAAFHTIEEEDVSEGLKQYVAQNNVDMVLIVPHKHNFYERLFLKGHTESILHAVPVPIMSVH